jgi:nucleoid DNA-binding protein
MEQKPRNLGRAYLVSELRNKKNGVSKRKAVKIVNLVFREMSLALKRGREVEFPFGWLARVKKVSRRWELVGDEPMNAYTVEHELDDAGYELLSEIEDQLSRRGPPAQ